MIEELFPRLRCGSWSITSPAEKRYNCIAWAAGDQTKPWWPWPQPYAFWPPEITRSRAVASFIEAYGTLDYKKCDSGALEAGYEKLALFVDEGGKVLHAARQLPDGRWTSKLGELQDIVHDRPSDLEGEEYGKVCCYLWRRTRTDQAG